MAIPRVFVSSTCYDLKYIRENLRYFITNLGYDPVLSDRGDVFYDPASDTQDACLSEVSTCQLLVLIIGGRFGGAYKETESSITNEEYREAIRGRIPVFALVEHLVYTEHHVFLKNSANPDVDETKINYPSCDDVRIFHFIDEVRKNSYNNALFSFRDFSDIEAYLKKQWAGMMHNFLTRQREQEAFQQTNQSLDNIQGALRKTEELIKNVYLRVDEANAPKVIGDMDRIASGRRFFDALKKDFEFTILKGVSLDALASIEVNQPWLDYLFATGAFHITDEDVDDANYHVLWCDQMKKGTSVRINDILVDRFTEFQRMFDDFARLDPKERRGILSELVNE